MKAFHEQAQPKKQREKAENKKDNIGKKERDNERNGKKDS